MKRILIFGGTQFVGRVLVKKLLEIPDYELTLFNRGKSNADLFPEVARIYGDRNVEADLDQIAQHDWDVIIDVSSYFPIPLAYQLNQLKGKVGRYIYVSTGSVYDFSEPSDLLITEDAPLVPCPDILKTDTQGNSYSARKAECERVILEQDWLDKIILRPGLIVGPYDYSDRLYYWIYRVQKRFAILLPGGGKNLLSFTDVYDFANIVIQSIEIDHQYEVYNTTSYISSIGTFVDEAKKQLDKRPNLIDASNEFLTKLGVKKWLSLPLWVDEDILMMDSARLMEEYQFSPCTVEHSLAKIIFYCEYELGWRVPGAQLEGYTGITLRQENEIIQLLMGKSVL